MLAVALTCVKVICALAVGVDINSLLASVLEADHVVN